MRSRRAGGTIVLTARKTSAGAWEGTRYTADEWITEVYVHTGDGWRCALSQMTPVNPEHQPKRGHHARG